MPEESVPLIKRIESTQAAPAVIRSRTATLLFTARFPLHPAANPPLDWPEDIRDHATANGLALPRLDHDPEELAKLQSSFIRRRFDE